MSYQALARTYRPRRFEDLIGQDHVVRALSHALTSDKLHHALLFSGTRGVGKTTLGRILAKCLNCERSSGASPCTDDPCQSCAEIDQGRFVDLIEVDAASRTGVDDTRELMENVQYAPTRGRVKVYLIDEVHMLSRHAFNALLKTLEEPPPRIQFLLATTDPQKIPVTILSRCLQFPLKRLTLADIGGQLERILGIESIDAESGAITAIARAADGSMRDALSLTDQAVAFGGGALRTADVHELLGSVGVERLSGLLDAIARGDATALWQALETLDERAPDYAGLHDALAEAWHRIAVLQLVPDSRIDAPDDYRTLADRLDPADVQLYYDICLAGRRDLDWAPDPRTGLEMTCLRMLAFRPADAAGPDQAISGAAQASSTTPASRPPSGNSSPAPPPAEKAESPEPMPAENPPPATEADPVSNWEGLIPRLGLRGMTAELARNCMCRQLDGEAVVLSLPSALQHMRTDRAVRQLREGIRRELGDSVRFELSLGEGDDNVGDSPARRDEVRQTERRSEAARALAEDPNVHALQNLLGAQLKEDSIEPRNGGGDEQIP
ncbi:DNA polymerase III subunit gamma/tau [Spectribacter hydrogenoxidans]|uniref:DNA polymerase III subunit gamma/tau n=1 Tax=Spectribacter hydrogenoxidans TaxID=3075608 RepID=A0ABU3C1J4_9GAMM|nr:DNA polymerase III subunit gamma/tau [Salinisphaera sp. W335]MDT0635427.1 DNA polymerase III subunit gamma/tau [Salinisphaera sp. W335]